MGVASNTVGGVYSALCFATVQFRTGLVVVYRVGGLRIKVVRWHVAIENRLALVAAPAACEFVPDSSVDCIVAYVQSRDSNQTAWRL